jgi:hypothetical protein
MQLSRGFTRINTDETSHWEKLATHSEVQKNCGDIIHLCQSVSIRG